MTEQSTQSAHPWRASVRTAGFVLLAVLAGLAAAGPEIVAFVEAQFPGTPAVGAVTAGSGFVVGLSLLLNRLALLEPVARAFDALGLGAAPKDKGATF